MPSGSSINPMSWKMLGLSRFKTLQISTASRRISVSACGLPRSSRKWRQARELPVTKILVSQALGRMERAACLGQLDVGLADALDRLLPLEPQLFVFLVERRHHVARLAFVHVTLRKLRVAEPRPVTDQLVRERAADARDQQVPYRMLEHAP